MKEDPEMARNDGIEKFLNKPTTKAAMAHLGIAPGNNVAFTLLMMAFNSGFAEGGRYIGSLLGLADDEAAQ